MIYFDNAATTYRKPRYVLRKTLNFIRRGYGNAGRGGYSISLKTAEAIYETREAIARLLSAPSPNNVVFFHNATEALNIAIKTSIPKGTVVLTSFIEHNSVLRPLFALEDKGCIKLSYFSHRGDIEKNIREKIRPNSVIVCSLVSNVSGEEIPISILSKIRKECNVPVIVDASQAFCHQNINLKENAVDIFCSAGHKGAMGMQGVAFSVYQSTPETTLLEGGSGVESFARGMPALLPERLEAGTLSAPAIASLKFGVEYIERYGIENIENKLCGFDEYINDELQGIPDIRLLAKGHCGIHSFVFNNQKSSITAQYLEKQGIMVRGGFHCAPLIHQFYNTEDTGAVRISLSIFNTVSEIRKFMRVLKKIRT